ncbi:hypothetical protein MLD52_04285 [Puniceicoccaceae bacterium K14]|nr:hypothetical protein [Puniceicoccaceae bacterium K14]
MSYRKWTIVVSLVGALSIGALTSGWQRLIFRSLHGDSLGTNSLPKSESLGQGLSLAILGGYRSIAANLIWLDMNGSWEKQNINETLAKIELATATDPRALFFWLNGARVVANDMPAWVIANQGLDQEKHPNTVKALNLKFSEKALELIENGLVAHPGNFELMVDRAVIHWKKREDLEEAAKSFLEIATMPNSPYFAGRLYAELLVELGRTDDALSYLKSIYSSLPDDDIQAMKPFVAERIRQLEIKLEEQKVLVIP